MKSRLDKKAGLAGVLPLAAVTSLTHGSRRRGRGAVNWSLRGEGLVGERLS